MELPLLRALSSMLPHVSDCDQQGVLVTKSMSNSFVSTPFNCSSFLFNIIVILSASMMSGLSRGSSKGSTPSSSAPSQKEELLLWKEPIVPCPVRDLIDMVDIISINYCRTLFPLSRADNAALGPFYLVLLLYKNKTYR
jgi:hypothetical protein